MTPDPAPDHIVIGIYADGAMLPFVLSSTHMALQILSNELFDFDLKTAVLARGLLEPAALQALHTTGRALLDALPATQAPADTPSDDDRPTWDLTLADAIAVATASDFMASAYLTSFGEEMRAVQVDHNGIPAAAYDAQLHETLGYLARFQAEWGELFGEYAGYQARMAELAELRAEFVG
ncbi:hypothetical protein [Hymenobacter terrenus]|uniref:hypothetical protein n=1 Tax=Hymenobacter terrenus TaxID=1629124 RepID=UPI0006192607|nr:hypothetical protein [Hymenobacter terrenus]